MDWLYNHCYNILCGMFLAILGYFNEIQGAVHVMWAALAFDLITGILASMIKRRERFSMKKAFIAILRAIGATILVMLLYAMDKEMHQEVAATYNIAAWLIAGFYAWSASENMDELLGGKIFVVLKSFFAKRVQDQTGVDLNDGSVHSRPPSYPSAPLNWPSNTNINQIQNVQNENGD